MSIDEDYSTPAPDVPIVKVTLNGTSEAEVSFDKLPPARSYYIAEVDENGNPVENMMDGFEYEVTYSENGFRFTEINSSMVTVTNKKHVPETETETETETKTETETEKPKKPEGGVKTGDDTPVMPMFGTMLMAAEAPQDFLLTDENAGAIIILSNKFCYLGCSTASFIFEPTLT